MARAPLPEQIVLQRLSTLARWLPGARKLDIRAVHQSRVATRRLREALPVVTSGGTRRRLAKAARRLTRALGPVRELDVALLTLDELEADDSVPQPAVDCLRASITEERRLLLANLQRRLDTSKVGKLKDRATAAARKLSSSTERDRPWVAVADQRCVRRANRLRTAIEDAGGIYLPDRLHLVRIALKRFRYAMEIQLEVRGARSGTGAFTYPPAATKRLRTLSQAQDLLGRMHDLEVLIARTRSLQGSTAVPNLQLSADLDRLVRRLETECRQLHGRYMTARASVVAICDQVEQAAERRRAARPAA